MLTRFAPSGCGDDIPLAPATYEVIRVAARTGGRTSRWSGLGFCFRPGEVAPALYAAAAHRDAQALTLREPLLHCDDDPRLLVTPTSQASVEACMLGLWTPGFERLIQRDAAVIGTGTRGHLFPRDFGSRPCAIPVRGSARRLIGECVVSVQATDSATPGVTFTESWPDATGGTKSHWWVIYLPKGQPPSLFQGGPRPPQL
jgi:hypothetical protein